MKNSLLIHNDNVPFKSKFTKTIAFKPTSVDIDEYITHDIIPQIKKLNPQIIYIKDNLSSNYLELYGLRLIYHIRLSHELGDKRLLPIVLLSDLDSFLLNKLSSMGRVLFTKNIFIVKNSMEAVKRFDSLKIQSFKAELYQDEFLNLIEVKPPKDYLSHHDISNEWAIYRWAKFLKVDSEAIRKNREKIASMLYFKYLLAHYPEEDSKAIGYKTPKESGKILYIDDEWGKGWSDICEKYFPNNIIIFNTYKGKFENIDELQSGVLNEIESNIPDIVILDLRLVANDHNENNRDDLKNYSGIKFAKKIKEENPGIQIIMFTATGNSLILEELYKYDILGYIKKGHPEDKSIKTKESFEKLATLVDEGLEKKYLKEVWDIQKSILGFKILENDDENTIKIKAEIETIFEILDSNLENKIKFTILTIFKVLEILTEKFNLSGNEFSKIMELFKENDLTIYSKQISQLVCTRNFLVHSGDKSKLNQKNCIKVSNLIEHPTEDNILEWFKMLQEILKKIENDKPNY